MLSVGIMTISCLPNLFWGRVLISPPQYCSLKGLGVTLFMILQHKLMEQGRKMVICLPRNVEPMYDQTEILKK